MRKIVILFVSLLCSTALFSQHNAIKVNGLELFNTYTEVQIFEALGNPTNSIYFLTKIKILVYPYPLPHIF